ncbi:MAG: xanthine dehydrogenase accessory protein XdhC [Deltaproteobacteria bacterium CG11_big_fil_rev_8_21_14_0_20_49_13]|nr:MAG: xanthine dehydrogenase accessory protein XdhC [Deltaproteobacteria bacterium CG11_big_fil_rev_8_21_14_0_20_49_13]
MKGFVLITVTKTSGSTPRHAGSKMIVNSDGSIAGTIGGGALEHQAIKDALEILERGEPVTKRYPLGPMLGQCCGGETELFFEAYKEPKRVVIFGAGHVAAELSPLLKKLGFGITLVDERSERLENPAFQIVDEKVNELPCDALKGIEFTSDLYLIVLTHQHKHDEEIVAYCLDKLFKYLGMIGSRTKWEKFKARYKAKGSTDEQLARVRTPIGLDIGSETPFEIAVSIVAELISFCHCEPEGRGNLP